MLIQKNFFIFRLKHIDKVEKICKNKTFLNIYYILEFLHSDTYSSIQYELSFLIFLLVN